MSCDAWEEGKEIEKEEKLKASEIKNIRVVEI